MAKHPGKNPSHGRNRLAPHELAQRLGSIAAACRNGDDRSTALAEWKRRYRDQGLDGIPDNNPPRAEPSPQYGVHGRIIALALENPGNGCQRISEILTESGYPLSHVSVQAILNKYALGNRNQRIRAIERQVLDGTLPETPERSRWIVDINPAYAEKDTAPAHPWQTVALAHATATRIPGLGKIHLHAAVDCWSQTGFAVAATDNQPEWPVSLLHNEILPRAAQLGVAIQTIRTSNSFTYHGTELHLFPLYLELNDIVHEIRESPDGHARRFQTTLINDFVAKCRKREHNGLDHFQNDLDHWTNHYNSRIESHGWPNRGLTPAQRIQTWRDDHPAPQTPT